MLAAIPVLLTVVYAFVAPPVSTLMLLRKIEGQPINYTWVPIEKMSPHLVTAVVTSEDARICSHNGVDWGELGGILEKARKTNSAPARGGSTIPMQTVKNLFLWPSRSYIRKAIEIPLAYWADLIWSKRRMVEIYINIAEWAPGVYGAEAAARHHFGTSASNINRRQAVRMAASLPNPFVRHAGRAGPKVRKMARRLTRKLKPTKPYLGCLKP